MGLFRRTPTAALDRPSAPGPVAPSRLWGDAFGRTATRALQIIVVVVVAAGIIFAAQYLTLVTIPLVLGLIIASALSPIVRVLRVRGLPPVVATLIVMLLVIAIIGGIGWFVVVAVRNQWGELADQAVKGFGVFTDWAQQLPFFPSSEELDSLVGQVTDFLTSAQFGSGAVAGVGAVASFVAGFILLIAILFFFLKDGRQLWEFLLRPFHGEPYARGHRIGDKVVGVFGAYVRGTAAVALVDALGILIGLLILQVPLAVPLAVLVFLLAFIPIVGATLAGILAALVALVSNGWVSALIVVGVVVLVNQLEGNLLQPVLMGRSMKLHPFVILVALTVGAALGGIVGAVLAVPITAAAWGVIQVWDGDDLPARWARRKPREKALAQG